MARSRASHTGWGSWKLSATLLSVAVWLVVPSALAAVGFDGAWLLAGSVVVAFAVLVLATVWLVPKRR